LSEELSANNYTENGGQFGPYELYTIGATTINALKKYNIVPDFEYNYYGKRKPDGLIVDRRNKSDIKVIAVIEYKKTSEFNTIEKKNKAYKQCNDYCQVLKAPIGIVTDAKEYYYLNPKVDPSTADESYSDDFGVKRCFSLILSEDGYQLSHNLATCSSGPTEINKSLVLISRIMKEISDSCSRLHSEKKLNPSNLAKKVWQSIWLASGENPDKCLSTFVEIFIFKYLSDLDILTTNKNGVAVDFDSVYSSGKSTCLRYYFNNVRDHVKELFPESPDDNTSIINGFILDPKVNEHNQLFFNILKNFVLFLTNADGSKEKLVNIDPEFKSRLFEDFLKRSISQKNWGQYFTPRNVVKAIIEVSGIENLPDNAVVGDPACGVGGFILEPLLTKVTSEYRVNSSKLNSKLIYKGLDRDPKVIIMAKSNMLIYLSELLRDNPTLTKSFAQKINATFRSHHESILGSLSAPENEVYDLVMANPPYVTKGIVNYKDAIANDGILKDYYRINGMGVECYFIEKIIAELKPSGRAFIIIPDGLLNRVNDHKVRGHIKKHCIIDGIVSLPIGTFYSTQKKTYVLILTKKSNPEEEQKAGVFSYVVTSIGESLDVYRIPNDENDLRDFVRQFKYFMLDKLLFEPLTINCQVFSIDKFNPQSNWCIERWWSEEDKIALGIEKEINIVDVDEYYKQVDRITGEIKTLNSSLGEIDNTITSLKPDSAEFRIDQVFDVKQGDAFYTLKRIKENYWEGDVPVYSSNTKSAGILTHILKAEIKEKDRFYDYCLTWAIDGMAGQLFLRNEDNKSGSRDDKYLFTVNNHCGIMVPKEKLIFYLDQYLQDRRDGMSKSIVLEELKNIYLAAKKMGALNKLSEHYRSFIGSFMASIEPSDTDALNSNIGKILAQAIVRKDGTIVAKKGKKLTNKLVKSISEEQVDSVYIYPLALSEKDSIESNWTIIMDHISLISKQSRSIIEKSILPLALEYYSNRIEIDLGYVMKNIQPIFFQRTRSYGNKKLGTNQIVDIELSLPIKEDGSFDGETMEKISREQDKISNIRNQIISKYSELGEMEIVI